jgi:hypothetical protein
VKKIIIAVLCSISIVACGEKSYRKADNAIDAAREFIDATLKGDFKRAAFYMLIDSTNQQQLEKTEKGYLHKTEQQRLQYNNASINILEDDAVNDSTEIINFKNSYDQVARKVKVVKQNDNWMVDFKYTFNGNL